MDEKDLKQFFLKMLQEDYEFKENVKRALDLDDFEFEIDQLKNKNN